MPKCSIKTGLSLLALVLVAQTCWKADASTAESLRVEGTLVYTGAPVRDWGFDEEPYSFEVLAQGSKWIIRMTPDDPEKRAITYTEVGCDGKTIYAFLEHNMKLVPPRLTNGIPIPPASKGVGMMFEDTVPSPLFFRCEALWLAYCSASHFQNSSGKARQVWLGGNMTANGVLTNDVPAEWTWNSAQKQYLSHVEYFPERNPKGKQNPIVIFDVPKSEFFEGADVPTEFTLVRFSEVDLSKKVPFVTFTCKVSRLSRSIFPVSAKPELRVPVMMMDYRFRADEDPLPLIQYLVTDGVWPEPDAVRASKRFQTAKRATDMVPASTKSRRAVMGTVFVASVVALAFVALNHRSRAKQMKE
jgi:hypothetical protein